MQLLPYQDTAKTSGNLSDAEMNIIVASIYFASFCFTCELVMALTNTWMFLIKQKRYKARPLLVFYILAISLAMIRIYTSFFRFYFQENHELFGHLLPAILKLNLGAVQCWIIFELGVRVHLNIRHTQCFIDQSQHKTEEIEFQRKMSKLVMSG